MKSRDNKFATGTLFGLLSLGLLGAPSAQTTSEGLPLWEIGIGTAIYNQPNYPGSDVRSTTAFPFPFLIYRGDKLRIDRSLQGMLYESSKVKLDLSAGSTAPVDSDDSDTRANMPDLDRTFDVGPSISLLLTDPARNDSIWGRLALRTAFSLDTDEWDLEQQGWVFDTRLRYQRPLRGEALKASAEIGASFADANYLGYFYDVSPAFATPERPVFDTDGGYSGARLGLGLSGIQGRWHWSVYGIYRNLAGTAFAESPLLDSNHDFGVGASVGWMFWQSERRASTKNTSPGGEFRTPLFGF